MTIRIWHQSSAPFGTLGAYRDALVRHVEAIVSEGTQVEFHGLDPALYGGRAPAEVLQYAYPRHLITSHIIENCIRAEQEGFDAVAIASFNDPYVREARSTVDIPVISMAESSLLIGCGVVKRLALITLAPASVWRLQEIVERHHLDKRVSGIYALKPKTDEKELLRGFADFDVLRGSFVSTCERAIADGAELVIAAEGVLNEVLFANGLHRVQDTPVLDCVGVSFQHAEMMVRLQRSTGLAVGRAWNHAKPDDALLSAVRKTKDYTDGD